MRRLVSPLWLVWHAFAASACVGMVFLGRWQLHRAYQTHSIQNYGYAGEWWVFAAFGLVFWARTVREALHPERKLAADEAQASHTPTQRQGPALPVQASTVPVPSADEDPEVAAYNDYLAWLAAHPKR